MEKCHLFISEICIVNCATWNYVTYKNVTISTRRLCDRPTCFCSHLLPRKLQFQISVDKGETPSANCQLPTVYGSRLIFGIAKLIASPFILSLFQRFPVYLLRGIAYGFALFPFCSVLLVLLLCFCFVSFRFFSFSGWRSWHSFVNSVMCNIRQNELELLYNVTQETRWWGGGGGMWQWTPAMRW